jgi:hypothetical protein
MEQQRKTSQQNETPYRDTRRRRIGTGLRRSSIHGLSRRPYTQSNNVARIAAASPAIATTAAAAVAAAQTNGNPSRKREGNNFDERID